MTEITRALAEHATGLRYDDLPQEAIEKARALVLDHVGIGLRASVDAESTGPVRDTVLALAGEGEASLLGQDRRVHPAHAALLNGTLAHSLDFDDTHRESSLHPGAAIIPVVLALGEQHGIDGRRAIVAIVAGYDVACKLGMAIDPKSHYARGFHPTGTVGVFGATAAGARVLGLSASGLADAFGVNGSQAAGSMQYLANGSYNKRVHPGLAAHNAVLALELARRGFVGTAAPIEGRHGVLSSYSDAAEPERAVAELGERFEILHTAIKPYPSCRYSHTALDVIGELVAERDLRAEAVRRVRIGLCDAGMDLIGAPIERKRQVANIVDGQFSMPFLAAVGLLRGRMTWSDYELVGDPRVADLMQRVDVVPDAEANAVYPERWLTSVDIETAGGTLSDRRWRTRGEPELPLSFDEVRAKFDDLASAVLEPDARRSLADAIQNLALLDDLAELGERLHGRAVALG
jgi:2-methylcitrate dehydratase PrpD